MCVITHFIPILRRALGSEVILNVDCCLVKRGIECLRPHYDCDEIKHNSIIIIVIVFA